MFRAGQQVRSDVLINRLRRGGFDEVWLAERRAKFVTTKVAVKLPNYYAQILSVFRNDAGTFSAVTDTDSWRKTLSRCKV